MSAENYPDVAHQLLGKRQVEKKQATTGRLTALNRSRRWGRGKNELKKRGNGEMKEGGLSLGWRMFTVLFLVAAPFFQFVDQAPAEEGNGDVARGVLTEINLARTEPGIYMNLIKNFRNSFDGKYYTIPGESRVVETAEGVAAVDEAINYLTHQKPLPPLRWSLKLAAAAAELVEEQGRSGAVGHDVRQIGGVMERSKRQGSRGMMFGENIAYGRNTPRNMVMQLIIDDGLAKRNHRKNQFNPGFTEAGVACGPHPEYEMMCVIDFSDERVGTGTKRENSSKTPRERRTK